MNDPKLYLAGNEEQSLNDYFVEKDGLKFAGIHLLLEFWGAKNLSEPSFIEQVLRIAAETAGATVLSTHAHTFKPNGVTAIAVLAESHISIHTWPSRGFAAIDIFMCGNCQPHASIVSVVI
jgi:S-adenosylmethionine decarboxylase